MIIDIETATKLRPFTRKNDSKAIFANVHRISDGYFAVDGYKAAVIWDGMPKEKEDLNNPELPVFFDVIKNARKNPMSIEVSGCDLLSLIKALSANNKKEIKPIVFDFTDGLKIKNGEIIIAIPSVIDAENWEGSKQIGFNPNLLLSALKLLKSNTVRLGIIGKALPVFLTSPDAPRIEIVVLPVRLHE
jgi:hypothetical protein